MTKAHQLNGLLFFSLFFIITTGKSQLATFNYTGSMQTYTVPADVYAVEIKCWGAAGYEGSGIAGGAGGLGGYAEGKLPVTPGEVLNVFTGGHGGYNGGGAAGDLGAGSGGGASDVRQGGITPAFRVIVAGGGGGGGMYGCPAEWTGGDGGAGGGGIGGNGEDSPGGGGGQGGMVGIGGGAGTGCPDFLGYAGSDDGDGGDGDLFGCLSVPGGGGGGGGYVVGGGGGGSSSGTELCLGDSKGGGGGGAGGSSYTSTLFDTYFEQGIRELNGLITIEPFECDPITVTVSADEICLGESITLDGSGAGLITWDGGVSNGVPFIPVASGELIYTATSDAGTDCGYAVVINVIELPVVATVDFTEVCIGEAVIFTGEGADEYVWDPAEVIDGESYSPDAGTATYTVTGTDLDLGCENTAEIEVTVHALPEVVAFTTEDTICFHDMITLTGGGADEYSWEPDDVIDGEAFLPLSVGENTYSLTGVDLTTGCENTTEIEIYAWALPDVIAMASAEDLCIGDELTLTGAGADSYTWFPDVIEDGVAFTPEEGTETYLLYGVDEESGCEVSDNVTVTVHELPEVVANSSHLEICLGDLITLFGTGATEYTWDPESVEDGVEFAPLMPGTLTYFVTGVDDFGCINESAIDIIVYETLEITYTVTNELAGGDGAINITVTGGNPPYIFDWDNDGTGDTDDTEDLSDLVGGTYEVIVQCDAGCTVVETIVVESELSTIELAGALISIYPNPTNHAIYIDYSKPFEYEITAINGAVLMTGASNKGTEISLENLSSGIYLIVIHTKNESITHKIVKE